MANAQHSRPAHSSADEVNIELDDTHSVRQVSEEAHHPPILVLSRDANLVETVKKAAPRGTPVAAAPDLDHVAEKLSNLKPGVLVADTASTADVPGMVAQLTQHFPELVVVVAGKREDSSALMQLTATGRIFRFLLTPLSHGQTRLALEAAVTHHIDLAAQGQRLSTASAGSEGGGKNYLVTYGALAAGLLVVVGGIWFGVSQFTSEPEVPAVTQEMPVTPSTVPEKPDPIQAELALAKEAFDQGKFMEPAGESALDFYRSALALDPNSAPAKDGIRDVVDKILERAETALTSERHEEASRNIEIARDIDPTHPRLSFLDTQMARERERIKLTQAQETVNRVRQLLSQATDRMQAGRLVTPANGSARDALVEARRLDPTDPNVVQAIREFTGMLAEEARKSLTANKSDDAQTFVNAARGLGSANPALAAVERQLTEQNRAAASAQASTRRPAPAAGSNDPMIGEIRQRMTEGKLIDPPGDSARDLIAKFGSASPNNPAVEDLSRQFTTRMLDMSRQATQAKAFSRAEQLLAAAREIGGRYSDAAISQAEKDFTSARDANLAATNIVSAASLTRTRTVNPTYPESARKRGVEGWVELAFTVTPKGTVDDVEVRNASPADVFDDAAVRAVRGWRFEPVVRNGETVAQRAMVRLRFSQTGQ